MTDRTTTDEQSEQTATNSPTGVGNEVEQTQDDHDCQDHLEFVDYEWVEEAYDDKYVCSVCEAEYRMVYAKAFLLNDDDYSLVEEYTDEIERELERQRKHSQNRQAKAKKRTASEPLRFRFQLKHSFHHE